MMQLHHKKTTKKVALTTNFYLLIYLFLVEVVQTLKKETADVPIRPRSRASHSHCILYVRSCACPPVPELGV